MGRRACIVAGLLAVLVGPAGCGGGSRPAAATSATPAGASAPTGGSAPSTISGCGRTARGWKPLTVRPAVDAATFGSGRVGVVFANDSGNDPCPWLPLADALARRGDRVAVFSYGSGANDAQLLAVARSLRAAGAREIGLVGASVGGRAVIQAAAHAPAVGAAVSLSAERSVGNLPEILPDARRVRVPSLYIGSREDGYTTFGRETREFHRVTPARVNRMLLVAGGDHGVDLLSDRYGPRVRAAIIAFLAANAE